MTSDFVFENAAGRVRVVKLGDLRDSELWRRVLRTHAKDHRYYEAVAATLAFDCHAFVLEDGTGNPRALQPFFFVDQDLMTTAPASARAFVAGLRKMFPRLFRLRMLMAGCAAGEGRLGAAPADQRWAVELLRAAMLPAARAHGASLAIWKDFPAGFRELFGGSKDEPPAAPYFRLPSMPATRLPLNFASFEDYMTRHLSHAMRKNLRRKFKALAGAPPITMTVTNELGAAADEALALYLQVFARSRLQFERLTKNFLARLATAMPERVRFFLWRQEGRLVAFSLCLVHDGAIYDEYLGLDYTVALDLHLYFVTFRDVLSWAIAQGLKTYFSTPLSYDPKLHLGFQLVPLDLYVAHPSRWVNALLRQLLPWIQPSRAEPALPHFPNADEMRAPTAQGSSPVHPPARESRLLAKVGRLFEV